MLPPQGPSAEGSFWDTFSKVTFEKPTAKKKIRRRFHLSPFSEASAAFTVTIENLEDYFTTYFQWWLDVECVFLHKQERALP